LPSLGVLEVVHIHAPRIAFGAAVRAAILEVADHPLVLDVDVDDRLQLRMCRNDFPIDVFELRVALGMLRTFIGLAIVPSRVRVNSVCWAYGYKND
jgi:hypothetical protein